MTVEKPTSAEAKVGRTVLRDPQLRRARVSKVISQRLMGQSIPKIAASLNASKETIINDIKYAKAHGMIESISEQILRELVPLAIETFKIKMKDDKDPFVAKTVLDQFSKLMDRSDRQQEVQTAVNSLAAYREKRLSLPTTVTVSPASPPVPLIEGEVSDAG